MDTEYISINYQCSYIRLPNGKIVLGSELCKYLPEDDTYILVDNDADDYDYDLVMAHDIGPIRED